MTDLDAFATSLGWIVMVLGSLAGFAAVLCWAIAAIDKEITGRRNA